MVPLERMLQNNLTTQRKGTVMKWLPLQEGGVRLQGGDDGSDGGIEQLT